VQDPLPALGDDDLGHDEREGDGGAARRCSWPAERPWSGRGTRRPRAANGRPKPATRGGSAPGRGAG
jgi:hypothetical protein